jgi:hypothetical protein
VFQQIASNALQQLLHIEENNKGNIGNVAACAARLISQVWWL